MRITMIGTSGSGKTVFSAAVYAVLMKKEFQGFAIFPKGENLASQLLETHKFNKDYKQLASHKWPAGTMGFNPFAFDLYYQGVKLTNFDWLDYRGGFLDEPTIDPASATELYANISASNAVILFADGEMLSKSENVDEAGFLSGADAVIQVIKGFSFMYPNSNLTFLIALTKCDAVDEYWKGVDFSYQPLVDHGRKVFYPLEEIYQRHRLWRGGIIPISAVGENVVENNNIVGFPKPLNVEHVMAFCISSILRLQQSDLISSIISDKETETMILNRYEGLLGAFRKAFSYFDTTNNDPETLKKLREDTLADLKLLRNFNTPLEKLADIAAKKVRILT